MVVGDDSQSIYSFRGANFKNIMDFPNLSLMPMSIKYWVIKSKYRIQKPRKIISLNNERIIPSIVIPGSESGLKWRIC